MTERKTATDYPHHTELIQPASIERQLAAYKIFQEFKQRILTKIWGSSSQAFESSSRTLSSGRRGR